MNSFMNIQSSVQPFQQIADWAPKLQPIANEDSSSSDESSSSSNDHSSESSSNDDSSSSQSELSLHDDQQDFRDASFARLNIEDKQS